MPEPGMGSRGSRSGSGMGGGGGYAGPELDWGMGPEGDETTEVSRSTGEDRDFGDDVSLQQKTAFMAKPVSKPVSKPVAKAPVVTPVSNVTNYLEDTTVKKVSTPQYEHPVFDIEAKKHDPALRAVANQVSAAMKSMEGAPDEYTRREVIASLANRKSDLLNRIPGGGMSILEAAGLRLGRGKKGPGGFIDIAKSPSKDWGGYYSPRDHLIMMALNNMRDPVNMTRVASHELGHSAWGEAARIGMLEDIPFSQLGDYARRFGGPAIGSNRLNKNDPFAFEDWKAFDPSTLTLQDMYMATNMANPSGPNVSGTYPVGHERLYNEDFNNPNLRQFDPRMRTAGYMNAAQGKIDYEDWIAYQRELPDEQHGGARVPHRSGYEPTYASHRPWLDESFTSGSVPWGPATIWEDEDGFPVKTGESTPLGYKEGRWSPYKPGPKYALNTDAGWEMANWSPYTHTRAGGLSNWPMGDQHALIDASTASYPMASGRQDFYGVGSRYNRYVGKNLADPRSRISAMHRQGLPRAAVSQLENYLANNPWSSGGGTETSSQVYDEIRRYLNRINADNNVLEQIENVGGG